MDREAPLIDGEYLLEKFPGKGGWTYALIPEIVHNKNAPFGWVTVRGYVDSYELKQYKLMPMGNGHLFLPLKKAVRKLIRKEAGDTVHIVLYLDESKVVVPNDLLACFENEPPQRLAAFKKLSEGEKKTYINWINDAKKDETKAERIIQMMDKLRYGLRLQDEMPG